MGVTIDAGGKSFEETGKLWSFFIYWFYIYFIRVFIAVDFIHNFLSIMSLSIWSCEKSFVILWYCSILVISLNMLFVSARCLHKYRILLIAKNTLLFKAFTSKNGMLSDVLTTVCFNKCILLSKCELPTGMARRKSLNWSCHSVTWNGLLYINHMTFKER